MKDYSNMNLIDLNNELDFLKTSIDEQKEDRREKLASYQKKIYNEVFYKDANLKEAEKRNEEMILAKKEQLNEELGINHLRRERQKVNEVISEKKANKKSYGKETVSVVV